TTGRRRMWRRSIDSATLARVLWGDAVSGSRVIHRLTIMDGLRQGAPSPPRSALTGPSLKGNMPGMRTHHSPRLPWRREFLSLAALAPALPAAWRLAGAVEDTRSEQLFFTSQGATALVGADGSGLQVFSFAKKDQATWQPGPIFPDGRRVIFL